MRIWCPSRKFEMKENEMYLEKKMFVAFSTVRLKNEVSFFIREFSKVFYFLSAFIVVIESF